MAYIRDEKTIKALGQQIRKIREKKGLTMEDIADKSNLAFSQIGRIERGEINTSISHIAVIAKSLGVKPKDLLDF